MSEVRSMSSTGGQKGVKLERHDLIPVESLADLARHFGRGAQKYAAHQWRNGYEWSKGHNALMRHQTAWWNGEDYDVCPPDGNGCSFVTHEGKDYEPQEPNTCYNHIGSHHLDAVMWHSFVLKEFTRTHPEHDDRYIPTKGRHTG